MSEHIQGIQHGHWYTVIEKIDGPNPYRVTTSSQIRNTQPQTFTNTLENAKKVAAAHMDEVAGL